MDPVHKLFKNFPKRPEQALKNQEPLGQIRRKKLQLSAPIIQQLQKEFFAFDLETTGLNRTQDRMVEIGILRYQRGQIVDQFNLLINPGFPMPKAASRVNHITDSMLENAPLEKEALRYIYEFLSPVLTKNALICAHNANFDIGFLGNAFERNGYQGTVHYLDTLTEARLLVDDVPNHKLGTLASYFSIFNDDPHRAIGDSKTCGALLLRLANIYRGID